jgi:hypothetical protein
MAAWRPGQFAEKLKLEAPYEDVPDHLRPELRRWLLSVLDGKPMQLTGVLLQLRLTSAISLDSYDPLNTFVRYIGDDSHLLLTTIELVLANTDDIASARWLENILRIGNSAYRVSDDQRRLEMRVMPEVLAATQATVDAARQVGSTAEHLAAAWNAAYGRVPDPSKAYAEAVRAVEGAAIPVVCPNLNGATLGNVRGDLRGNPQAWQFAIADGRTGTSMDRVVAAISMLWEGHEDRHAGVANTPEISPEAGRAAVDLAVMLVQWFVSGAITKRSS